MDIKTICVVASAALSFCTFVGGAIAFIVLKFNDMTHLQKNYEKINDKLEKLLTVSNSNTKDIAVIQNSLKMFGK